MGRAITLGMATDISKFATGIRVGLNMSSANTEQLFCEACDAVRTSPAFILLREQAPECAALMEKQLFTISVADRGID